MAADDGRRDQTGPASDETQPLTNITNEAGNEQTEIDGTATDKGQRRTFEVDSDRPTTATPSLFTQASIDSGFGDESRRRSDQDHSDNIDQQLQGSSDGQPYTSDPLVTTGYEELNITQEQGEGLHHALIGEQLAEEQVLVADDEFDSDSALGSDTESTTTSLTESIWNYRKEHGRTYHAYKDGKYIFPNDEREADRLDLQHHLFGITFAQHLYFAPLHLQKPQRALDVGTGTGIWAIEFADEFPDCQVTGIDLSPGQPSMVPPNCKFVVDDAEDLWIYPEKFDYIHARLMAGCFADWPNFLRQAYENLEPGGWLEIQDYGLPVKSADGTANGTDLMRWGELLCEAARNMGRPMGSDCADNYLAWMSDAGFTDINHRMFMWPSNGWPKDPLMKTLGQWNQTNILEGLEGFCLALFTRALGWRKEEVDVFVAKVSNDLRNRRIHAYFPMPVLYGRKPFPGEVPFAMR